MPPPPVAPRPAAPLQPPEQAEVIPGEPEKLGLSTFTRLGLDWPVTVWIISIHALALAAPFYFTWKALALAFGLPWLTGSIGVCMGYHRQLTHGSFCTYRPIRWLLALIGGLSGEGSALDLGGQPSQASRVQRQGRRSALARATASGGATCCGSCPTLAASITKTTSSTAMLRTWPRTR